MNDLIIKSASGLKGSMLACPFTLGLTVRKPSGGFLHQRPSSNAAFIRSCCFSECSSLKASALLSSSRR
jgi:hypothetical protein